VSGYSWYPLDRPFRFFVLGFAAGLIVVGQEASSDVDAGRVFEVKCAGGHCLKGGGGFGPSLNRLKLNKAPDDQALRFAYHNSSGPEFPQRGSSRRVRS
jgi:hypothetical protein